MNRIVTLPPLPDRPREGHKGMFGRVMIVGGSEWMIGAPVFAGTAALRMGAGLVYVAMPENLLAAALTITPELIGLSLRKQFGSKDGSQLSGAGPIAAYVVGPGMGPPVKGFKLLRSICGRGVPSVYDADALNQFAFSKTQWWKWIKSPGVLTPHPGEMLRLSLQLPGARSRVQIPDDDAGRIELAALAAKTFGQLMVLKGHRTVVTDGDRIYVNRTGDSSLSKAGTGDVLSGMIGTLLAQKMDRFDAAVAAVWIHGKAGEIAGQRLGMRSVLARDVIEAIPPALAMYQQAL
jgi:NAD(P)H-hydrate epimerase